MTDSIAVRVSERHERQKRLLDLYQAVFGNDLLRDKILEHVVRIPERYDYDRKKFHTLSRSLAQPLRQVSRSWMHSISIIFRRFGEPLFHVWLFSDAIRGGLGYSIQSVVDTLEARGFFSFLYAAENNYWTCHPPFSMGVCTSTHEVEPRVLLRILEILSSAPLLELYLTDPGPEDPSFTLPANLKFPQLQEIHLDATTVQMPQSWTQQLIPYIQGFLNASPNLKAFRLEEMRHPLCPNWTYPSTLRKLDIGHLAPIPDGHQIPAKLTYLKLSILGEGQLEAREDILKILRSCKSTLEELYIECLKIDGLTLEPDILRLNLSTWPTLPKLKKLWIKAGGWVMNPLDRRMPLDVQFPALEHLSFRNTWGGFGSLVEGFANSTTSRFSLVRTLDIKLNFQPDWDPTLLRGMGRLNSVLPNLTNLKLKIEPEDVRILRKVFLVMRQLESLIVHFDFTSEDELVMEEELDAVLIGSSRRIVKELRDDPELEGQFLEEARGGQDAYEYGPSIRDMANLVSFSIHDLHHDCAGMFSLSAVAFTLGFMLAPNLRQLSLQNFEVTPETAQMWRAHGGTISIE